MELLHNWKTFQSSFPWQGWRQEREGDRESSRAEVLCKSLWMWCFFACLRTSLLAWSWLVVVGLIKTGLISVSSALRTKKDTAVRSVFYLKLKARAWTELYFFPEVSACIFCLPLLLLQALTKPENYFAHGYFYQQFMLYLFVTLRDYQS